MFSPMQLLLQASAACLSAWNERVMNDSAVDVESTKNQMQRKWQCCGDSMERCTVVNVHMQEKNMLVENAAFD